MSSPDANPPGTLGAETLFVLRIAGLENLVPYFQEKSAVVRSVHGTPEMVFDQSANNTLLDAVFLTTFILLKSESLDGWDGMRLQKQNFNLHNAFLLKNI